jgi:16S rRNA (cytidine1402-2'-O)-methyltransferase
MEKLENGKNIALVSDAGTPGISDPGSFLISQIPRRNLDMSTGTIDIVAVPGASAIISALSISGFTGGSFVFEGFLPHKKGRETIFKKMAESKETHVFYESPHRIMKTLDSLVKLMPERQIMLGRELTKHFEEIIKGTPTEVIQVLENNPEKIRGEFVGIIFA